MRTGSLAVLLSLALVACEDRPTEPEQFVLPLYDHGGDHQKHFRADSLNGTAEVPPRVTDAWGKAYFEYEGDSVRYRLAVRSIRNVTQAHIHIGPPDSTGGIVAWLYPDEPPSVLIPGRYNGVLGAGALQDDEVVGSLAGTGVEGLVEAMRSGRTYVNVHTSQYGAGEIRGQIE